MQSPLNASDWHARARDALYAQHSVDPNLGLSPAQAQARLEQQGANVLQAKARRTVLALLLDQFKDFMVLVLLAAAVISGVVGDRADTVAILVILLLNAGIGFVQTWRADRAMDALQQLAAAQASVLRDGEVVAVPASSLVTGDIVLLEAGNQIAADMRLIAVAQLRVDESALTGESVTVAKLATDLPDSGDCALGERLNMAFKGTTVTHGRARGIVVATGMATELGKVAQLLDTGDRSTPLQRRLSAFGKRLALVVLVICAVVFALGVWRGEDVMVMLLTAISLAVAAIPEAMPAVVTVLLALGARRMVAVHALVRRLPSVETLGSVTVICSDKTGTLTQNRMHAELVLCAGQRWQPGTTPADALQTETLQAAALCNDAHLDAHGHWTGDPTEIALGSVALDAKVDNAALRANWPRVQEFPFDAERKRMTTVHAPAEGTVATVAYTKGAPESVLSCCKQQWLPKGAVALDTLALLSQANVLAAQGLRVLAFARRDHAMGPPTQPAADTSDAQEAAERDLQFLGFIALIDPPRPEAAAAVHECIRAGITPVMITGDHPATAQAIAHRLGIVAQATAQVLTGKDLATLDEGALRSQVEQVRVYARVDPAQKIRIVQALQAQGHIVAMTGDGVNDAPALRAADIGVAMGKNGTDVAREAASMVLLDDNFATIVAAVREGRRIYDNIRKFVRYAMTGNSGEIWTLFLAPFLMLPMPLLPIHILWVNLVTDGLPGLALAAEPAEKGVMERPPRAPTENLFANGMWQHILGVGLLIGALCLGVQAWAMSTEHAHWQTMVFTVLTLSQMVHVMVIRSEHRHLWQIGFSTNRPLLGAVLLTFVLQMAVIYVPWLQPIFKTQALTVGELGICLGVAAIVGVVVELEKAWRNRRAKATPKATPVSTPSPDN